MLAHHVRRNATLSLFGTRNIGDLSPADMLWLYQVIKKLHNGFKNAMLVDTSRN